MIIKINIMMIIWIHNNNNHHHHHKIVLNLYNLGILKVNISATISKKKI